MKSILYVGATLMIGASIYGFVDYKKTSRNKEFAKMYDAKEVAEPAAVDKKTTDVVAEPQIVVVEKKTETKTAALKNDVVNEKTAAVTEKPKVAKKKKLLNYKLFSRGPLEDKYLKKELKLPDLKALSIEPGKTENKEK